MIQLAKRKALFGWIPNWDEVLETVKYAAGAANVNTDYKSSKLANTD
jgi:hypothetical protein